ncbi:hypothetical protein [Brevundimonas variabilis]|uniref:Glucan phosphoethanolaminetransferase (Alkaline phosphatase superfamily) n=1 Tax=Brevundimonas variabilis TaxID=74312 RepID=A0A7W9CIE6_9CAUL|nr:hypothetical protein [Brevundimonas variabilis]MBB5746104.1 glucan phosphoethanolaminetransferase (alkaline phosphatase superfamily) [Brevundimonas variabilis]
MQTPAPFSASQAAFEGFRLTRTQPMAVLAWGGVWLIGLLAMGAAMMPAMLPFAEEITAAAGNPDALSAEAQAAILSAVWYMAPIGLVIQALLAPALYRAVLKPEARRFAYLRVGMDELRALIIFVATAAISFALSFGGDALESLASQTIGSWLAIIIGTAVSMASIYLAVRFSLLAPRSVNEGRFVIKSALDTTQRLFWPLLGMGVIAGVMAVLVVLLLVVVALPLTSLGNTNPVAALALLALVGVGLAMVSTVVWAPFALAARGD